MPVESEDRKEKPSVLLLKQTQVKVKKVGKLSQTQTAQIAVKRTKFHGFSKARLAGENNAGEDEELENVTGNELALALAVIKEGPLRPQGNQLVSSGILRTALFHLESQYCRVSTRSGRSSSVANERQSLFVCVTSTRRRKKSLSNSMLHRYRIACKCTVCLDLVHNPVDLCSKRVYTGPTEIYNIKSVVATNTWRFSVHALSARRVPPVRS